MSDIPDVRKANPWDRLPDETDKAWTAFQVYLDLPRPRRYKDVADKTNRHVSQVGAWGMKYKWVARAGAWDNSQMGVLTPDQRDEALGGYQLTIIADAHEDYNRLRSLWVDALERAASLLDDEQTPTKPGDIKALIQARNQLDLMARRTARMPMSFTAQEDDGLKEDKTYYLDVDNGPMEIEGVIE